MHQSRRLNVVGRVVALLFAAQGLALQILTWKWDPGEVAGRTFLGNDFTFLYSAAGHFLSGKSPYDEPYLFAPPLSLYLPLIAHHFSFWNAMVLFRTVCLLLVVTAMVWLCRQLKIDLLNSAIVLLITLTYVPFYMVLTGGNLDALMLAFLVFACAKRQALRGAFLGLSVGTKFYSGLMIPVFAARRRWKELAWAAGTLVVLLLPFFPYLPDAFFRLFHRFSSMRLNDNESPAVLFILLFGEKRVWAWVSCYLLFWGGTLALRFAADLKNITDPDHERFIPLNYLPWMAAAPVLVFSYTATILLPVMALLIHKNQKHRLNWADWLVASGFLLTGIYSALFQMALDPLHLAKAAGALNYFFRFLGAPLGISMILIGSSVAAWKLIKGEDQSRLAVSHAIGK